MTSADHKHPNAIAGVLSRVKGLAGVKSLAGLAGAACAACCIIPLLLAAGVLTGAGWSAVVGALPTAAVALAAGAGLLYWWNTRRRAHACATDCSCSTTAS